MYVLNLLLLLVLRIQYKYWKIHGGYVLVIVIICLLIKAS